LVREGSERWRFAEPSDREADGLACERAVAAFWRFGFQSFIDERERRAEIEATTPQAEWIVFRGGEVDTVRIISRLNDDVMIAQHSARAPGIVDARLHDLLTGGRAVLEVRGLFRGTAGRTVALLVVTPEGHRLYRRDEEGWTVGELESAALAQAERGRAPREAHRRRVGRAEAAIEGELGNLFWLRGEAWLPELSETPVAEDFPLRLHLWDADGTHQWAYLRPEGPAAEWRGAEASEFRGVAVTASEPRRPMRLRGDVVSRWILRARRTETD
jgi:hypothetical protein